MARAGVSARQPTATSRVHYLAYGSNLHPLRLTLRTPSARFVGTAELRGYRLAFHKRGRDGSGKCDLERTRDPMHVAHGAVFELAAAELDTLDRIEGVGAGYDRQRLSIDVGGRDLPVFTYVATRSHITAELVPYSWYTGLVLAGARLHRFPSAYVDAIAAVASLTDPDRNRREEMESLLARLAGLDDGAAL